MSWLRQIVPLAGCPQKQRQHWMAEEQDQEEVRKLSSIGLLSSRAFVFLLAFVIVLNLSPLCVAAILTPVWPTSQLFVSYALQS